MAIRKNKKRIDPRYFLNETTYRDEIDEGKETLAQWEATAITPEEVKKDDQGVYYIVPRQPAMEASRKGAVSVQAMADRGPNGEEMFLVRPGSMSKFNI
jgi:hypothetical protein